MKLAEKLATMSNEQATKEETVINEIVNFFAEKFESGETMKTFERNLFKEDIRNREKNIFLDFWVYSPGCTETNFQLLGRKWIPEDKYGYEYKGVNLNHIYKDVLAKIAKLVKENFEREGFEVNIRLNDKDRFYETYIIEVSW